jgi:predicted dehydrogenase
MMKTVNWGILGASNFAWEQMAPAIHAADGARFAAIATSDPAKAKRFQAFNPDLKVHSGYEALLADPDIQAVYIPLPNHLHVEWSKKALQAGKNVLCEKPIAMRAEDIDGLIALRDKTGLLAAEAFMIIQHPQFLRARQYVAEGAIGRIEHVDSSFSYDNRDEPENIRNRPETGGGSLPDIGVYTIGSARFVTGGEPVLDTITARIRRERGVEVFTTFAGEFEGPEGRFTYGSMTSMRLFPRQEVTYQGTKGLIRLTAPYNANVFGEARVELHRPGLSVTVDRFPQASHYRLQVEAFSRSVATGAAYPCPLEWSRKTQELIDRVYAVATPI